MNKKLFRTVLAVFLAVFMCGTSVNPAVFAINDKPETETEEEEPKTEEGNDTKKVITGFELEDIPAEVKDAKELPDEIPATLEGEAAETADVAVEWTEKEDAFTVDLKDDSYTLSDHAKSQLDGISVSVKEAEAEEKILSDDGAQDKSIEQTKLAENLNETDEEISETNKSDDNLSENNFQDGATEDAGNAEDKESPLGTESLLAPKNAPALRANSASYTISIKLPSAGYDFKSPNYEVSDDSVSVWTFSGVWVPTEEDVLKLMNYAVDRSAVDYDDITKCTGKVQAGVKYYTVIGAKFPDAVIVDIDTLTLEEDDNVKHIRTFVNSDDNEVIIAFSVIVPAITVTVDFGSAHKNFAQNIANASDRVDMTVSEDGKLTYKAEKGSDLWFDVLDFLRDAIENAFDSEIISKIDNGEMFYQEINYSGTNIKPMAEYEDYAEWFADIDQCIYDGGKQNQDVILYAQWAKPTGATISVTLPLCGTEVTLEEGEYGGSQNPAADISVKDGNVRLADEMPPMIYKEFSFGSMPFTGTISANEEYSVVLYIGPKFSYYIDSDKVTIENGTVNEQYTSFYRGIVVIDELTVEHNWGDWEVTKEPTFTEKGEETRTCSGCGETETREIDKVTYSIISGNGQTWTKGGNGTADFEFTRSYKDTAYDLFTEVQIDGKKVTDFTKAKGSVITKINASYMNSLSIGDHTITAKFSDGGSVSADFTVKEKAFGGGSTPKKPSTPVENVVTCQMAGYPSNYAWNEAAKACQAGYIDAGGTFHPYRTPSRIIPNTSDRDIMIHAWIAMLSITIGLFCGVKLLHEDWEV